MHNSQQHFRPRSFSWAAHWNHVAGVVVVVLLAEISPSYQIIPEHVSMALTLISARIRPSATKSDGLMGVMCVSSSSCMGVPHSRPRDPPPPQPQPWTPHPTLRRHVMAWCDHLMGAGRSAFKYAESAYTCCWPWIIDLNAMTLSLDSSFVVELRCSCTVANRFSVCVLGNDKYTSMVVPRVPPNAYPEYRYGRSHSVPDCRRPRSFHSSSTLTHKMLDAFASLLVAPCC